ncbi:MAG: hypothetical protein H6922_04560 [Pseudomonadaceae bacterium]|nr:hypothetical protein [Pseudomonadaceae bacterium]
MRREISLNTTALLALLAGALLAGGLHVWHGQRHPHGEVREIVCDLAGTRLHLALDAATGAVAVDGRPLLRDVQEDGMVTHRVPVTYRLQDSLLLVVEGRAGGMDIRIDTATGFGEVRRDGVRRVGTCHGWWIDR